MEQAVGRENVISLPREGSKKGISTGLKAQGEINGAVPEATLFNRG